MRPAFFIATVLLSLVTLSGCGQPTQPATENSTLASAKATQLKPANVLKTGEALFTQHCAGCHMLQDPSTKALYQRSSALASAESLITLVRNPAPRPMPAFNEATLPDADVATLQAWLVEQVKP